MAYTKQVWRDLETGGTPITAERLNHIEDGIEENSQNWDSISHIQVRARKNVSFNVTNSFSQSVTSIKGFTDINPDSIVAFIPVISASSVSSVNAAVLWNTNNGHNDLQLVTSQAQTIKVDLTVVYTVD